MTIQEVSANLEDIKYRIKSAKTFSYAYFDQKVNSVLYQGEEIGMTNHKFDSINQFDDLEVGNLSKALKFDCVSKKDYL